jgi:hypothetical protein
VTPPARGSEHGTRATPSIALEDPDPRVGPLAAALAARLRAVCQDWDAAEFNALVERMARTKLSWTDRGWGA